VVLLFWAAEGGTGSSLLIVSFGYSEPYGKPPTRKNSYRFGDPEHFGTISPACRWLAADSPVKPGAVEALEQMCMLMQQRCRLEVEQSTRKRFDQ